ncbi:hypothetical protein CJO94_00915 [Ralstonia solanacearum]|nr:hypothetical protein CJO94_00915 [Ralstonia solanacearum]
MPTSRLRAQVATLTKEVPAVIGKTMKSAFADQGYTSEDTARTASDNGIDLQIVKFAGAEKALSCRWVVAGLLVTTSDCSSLLPVCTSLSAACSCLFMLSPSFKVHNML